MKKKKLVLVLPARSYGRKVVYLFKDGINARGSEFELSVRKRAKKTREYHIPVRVRPEVTGRTDKKIPINTLGKWLFGVPGYAGNATFYGLYEAVPKVVVKISPAMPEVVDLIDRLFTAVGGVRAEDEF